MAKIFKPNAYVIETFDGVAKNSLSIDSRDFVKKASGVVDKAGAGDTIVGISQTKNTFASNNQTVALDIVEYSPIYPTMRFELAVTGGTLAYTDEGKYADLDSSQRLDYTTLSTTTGQVQIQRAIASGTYGVVTIANV